jgi:hypothetical protein
VSGRATLHPTNGRRGVWLSDPKRWKSLNLHKFHLGGNGNEIAIVLQNLFAWLSRGMARRRK